MKVAFGITVCTNSGAEEERESMGKKLFVGGLSWGTNDENLRQAFEKFGEVDDARVISDRDTGRSRGFGFVTFHSDDAAMKAMSEMDGASLDGRNLKVNEAQEKPRTGGGRDGGGRDGGGRDGGGRGDRGNRW